MPITLCHLVDISKVQWRRCARHRGHYAADHTPLFLLDFGAIYLLSKHLSLDVREYNDLGLCCFNIRSLHISFTLYTEI